jgi:DNA-binding transcriptional LysR family regulator
LPEHHPLAAKPTVSIGELANEPVLVHADASPEWTAFWTIDPRPDGSHPPQGPVIRDMEEVLEYVKAGRGVSFLPRAITNAFPRPAVTYVPVTDIAPGQIALAWNATHHSPLVADLAEAATVHLAAAG